MKTIRTRVTSAFRRNSKGVPSNSVPLDLPASSVSAPAIVTIHDKVDGTSPPPVSPATPSEKILPLPFHLEPRSESPVAEKHSELDELDPPVLKFTGNHLEQVYTPPQPISIMGDSRHGTPKKRVKSVPRVSSDDWSPLPSITSRIQTTLPSSTNNVEEVKFVSPIDPNYLIDDIQATEPRLLDQPAPTDKSFVEYTPKEVPSSLPPLHEVLAHQAHLKELDFSIEIVREASLHEPNSEAKPLLEPSYLSTEVDDILDSVWPLPSPSFLSLGWTEHVLPSSAYYYSHAATRTVTDIDLRNEKKLAAVRTYLKSEQRTSASDEESPIGSAFRNLRGDSTPRVEEGVDFWLRDANPGFPSTSKSDSGWEFMPMRNWVLHATRAVTFDPPPERDVYRAAEDFSDEDRLDLENRYWQYMSTHPAHVSLPQTAHDEAVEVVTWCYTDRVLRTPQPFSVAPPFTQRECVELLELLKNIASPSMSAASSAARTRIVAQVLLRYTEWRQKYIVRSRDKQIPSLAKDEAEKVEHAIPFRKTFIRFVKGVLCLGIPYLFEPSRSADETWSQTRSSDEEQGEVHSRLDHVGLGSNQVLVAALLLGASVTFLALPGLNGPSRAVALLSTLCSSASMMSYVINLHARSQRHGITYTRPPNTVLVSLPLVMLAYSLCAFIAAVIAYALGGTTELSPAGFGRYTGWTVVVGSLALVAVLVSSVAVIKTNP